MPAAEVIPGLHRPADLALRQQRIKGWKPILDPTWVICSLVVIAAIFIPVGTLKVIALVRHLPVPTSTYTTCNTALKRISLTILIYPTPKLFRLTRFQAKVHGK